MAFPTIVAVNNDGESTNATTFTCSVPDGSNVVGRTVIIFVTLDGTVAPTWPAGWSVLNEGQIGVSSAYESCRYRVIDGTEGFTGTGDTISITIAGGEQFKSIAYLLENAGTPSGTNGGGSSTNANPPSHTPPGGLQDYLWIVFAGWNGDPGSVTGYPSGYTGNNQSHISSGSAGNVRVAGCDKTANASSDDPGTFTSPTGDWRCITVAVPYAASVVARFRTLLGVGR